MISIDEACMVYGTNFMVHLVLYSFLQLPEPPVVAGSLDVVYRLQHDGLGS